ncbi:hypothetical protein K3495_g7836 [Podosphaera aphanis]|nr:hypothetical protein K3495_g7836 [Podosphaera aphanis]
MTSNRESEERQPQLNESDSSPLFVLPTPPEGPGVLSTDTRNFTRSIIRYHPRFARQDSGRITDSNRWGMANSDDVYNSENQPSGREVNQENTNLGTSLDDAVSDLLLSRIESQSPVNLDNRRAKRRKLNPENSNSRFSAFNYGRFGQVEPGKLKMEIVSCDGGIFDGTDSQHPAENILENDSTVYCTKANRCNLILRHQGATVFCLKELCIKAPHSGYTAPVQEGMVFISMTSDDLLARTAQYQIQYSPPRSRQDSYNSDLPSLISIRRGEVGTMTDAQIRARRLFNIGRQDEECDHRTAQIPLDFTPEYGPPFNVTTECSDSESDELTSHSINRGSTRSRLRLTATDDSDGNDDDEEDHDDDDERNSWQNHFIRIRNHNYRRQRLRRRETASNITLLEAAQSSKAASQDATKHIEGGLMSPHARFFIERDKSKCTVKFDPPVSGRFILLKMWSPHHDASGNIDIQSVVVTGFAGPRYFPAMKLV